MSATNIRVDINQPLSACVCNVWEYLILRLKWFD